MTVRYEGYEIGPIERESYMFQKGLKEGLARSCAVMARVIRTTLRGRGMSVPRRLSTLLSRCNDLDVMFRVLDRALEGGSVEELVVLLQPEARRRQSEACR